MRISDGMLSVSYLINFENNLLNIIFELICLPTARSKKLMNFLDIVLDHAPEVVS